MAKYMINDEIFDTRKAKKSANINVSNFYLVLFL